MIWTETGDKCRKTCDEIRYKKNVNADNDECRSNFFDGCSCPTGYYLREDQTCTTQTECGCHFQDMDIYLIFSNRKNHVIRSVYFDRFEIVV